MVSNSANNSRRRLTAAFVRNAKEPGKYYDEHGLFLRVTNTGAGRWVQRLRIQGKSREIGLGSASLVSLADARNRAMANRVLAREGGNPLQAKKEADGVLSFEEAARKVYEIRKPSWSNAKHAAQFISTLETYAFPKIGEIKVGAVTTADVLEVLLPFWLEKPETARRVRQRIGVVMAWAIAQGWRQDNPATAVSEALPKQTTRPKHRLAIPYDEVSGAIETVNDSGAGQSTKQALEFLVLTAARSGEVRLAQWSEIDLGKSEWKIPAQRMKAKRQHRVPLSPRAIEILEAAKLIEDGSGLVFSGTRYGKPLSDMTLSKLVKSLGIKADVHGFRTSFKTYAQERTNAPREVSEAALAHVVTNKAEAAYARSDLFDKRRDLMERWSEYLTVQSNVLEMAVSNE